MENDKKSDQLKEKKKLSLKDIGPSKLLLLLLAGILMLVSFPNLFSSNNGSKDDTTNKNNSFEGKSNQSETGDESDKYIQILEDRLQNILAKVDGIGAVEVMITLKGSKQLVTLKDKPFTQESMNENDGEGGSRASSSIDNKESTVIISDTNGENTPYVIQELEPEVEGVLVIAEGGDNVVIKSEIMDAAQVLFDVPAHKVKVMKMK